jgi:hypothetical protein
VDHTKAHAWRDSMFWPIHFMQKMVDIPTWMAKYDSAKAEGKSEEDAVALADQAVKDTQGSGLVSDRAGVMRGNEFKQMWTVFGSFFNANYNLAVKQAKLLKHGDATQRAKAAGAMLMLTVLPATMSALLMLVLRGDDDLDDPKKLAKRLAAENVSYLLNMMMFVRELSFPVAKAIQGEKADYTGPGGGQAFVAAGRLANQLAQGDFDRAMLKSAVSTTGSLFHLPAAQINRLIDFVWAQANDRDVQPWTFIAGPPHEKLK